LSTQFYQVLLYS